MVTSPLVPPTTTVLAISLSADALNTALLSIVTLLAVAVAGVVSFAMRTELTRVIVKPPPIEIGETGSRAAVAVLPLIDNVSRPAPPLKLSAPSIVNNCVALVFVIITESSPLPPSTTKDPKIPASVPVAESMIVSESVPFPKLARMDPSKRDAVVKSITTVSFRFDKFKMRSPSTA